jgi:hypothetical protein
VTSIAQATESSQVSRLTETTSLIPTGSTAVSTQVDSQETSISQMSVNQKKLTCRWTDDDDAALVHCLIDEKAAHPSATNGFKPVSWVQVVIALEGSELVTGSKAKDASACKSRWHAVSYLSSNRLYSRGLTNGLPMVFRLRSSISALNVFVGCQVPVGMRATRW